MFNNTVKKVVSIGLLFSLCAPCSFASAQNGSRNIPTRWSYLSAMQQAAQPAQLQPSALERLWNEYYGREYIAIQGRHFNTAGEFANEIRKRKTPLPVISRGILNHLIAVTNIGLNEALSMTQEIIIEIYNLDKIEASRHTLQALEVLKANPILSTFISK